jgi:tetratricopeptide (TPR) repeat protein
MSMLSRVGIGVLTFALASCWAALLPGSPAPASTVWGELKPGPYAVGFRAFEKYDYSRSFEAKKDYFGAPLPGERGRPVQVCIWYPGAYTEDASPMVYGEYAFVYPEDSRLYDLLSNLQDREVGVLYFMFNNDLGAVVDLQSEEMAAVRDAPAAPGRFPLILYAPHFNINVTENLILCEYLASHGFVVASTHAYGAAGVRSGEGPVDVEVLVTDLGFVLAALREFDFVDHDRVGVMGSGGGGIAALLFQMGNLYVDAVVGLNARFLYSEFRELAAGSPRFDVRSATVPVMQICGGAREDFDPSLLDTLEYSDRYSLAFMELSTMALSSYRMFLATAFGTNEAERMAYEAMCEHTLSFFDAYLNGNEVAKTFLASPPEDKGLDAAQVAFTFMPGREVPPTEAQFMAILQEHGPGTAVELFEKFRAEDPELVLFQENTCNFAGYGFLQRGRTAEAIAVFRMNAETYPGSANTWDSLAEAYVAAGDSVHALECYRKVLEVLPADAAATEELKEALRSNAEQYLGNPEQDQSN